MKWLAVFWVCSFAAACTDKQNLAGVDVIPKQEMAAIIWDIMQVDEYATSYIARDSLKNMKLERIHLYRQVFQLHKVTEKDFTSNFKYYSGHPDMMKVVFDTLGARAERERQKAYMPDSLKPR